MRRYSPLLIALLSGAMLAAFGCREPRGKPGPEPEVPRPDQVVDFATLYKQNCVACHGDNHQPGAAISLANPVFLALAGESNLKGIVTYGVPGKLMPAFGQSAGGMLTEQQVEVLAKGMISTWGKPGILDGQNAPPFEAELNPSAAAGRASYSKYCAACHGANGEGNSDRHVGSIVDASYLALISDQELRNFVIAGAPGMPDWRSDNAGHPLSDQEVTDVVAWVGSHRTSSPVAATSETSGKAGPKPKLHVSAAAAGQDPALKRKEPQP